MSGFNAPRARRIGRIIGSDSINKPFRNASKPWEWLRSKEIGFCTSWSREMLNGVSLLVNSCFKDRIGSGFDTEIVTGDKKWVHYDNPKRRKLWGMPWHASTSTPRPNIHCTKFILCILWDQLGVVYYELLKPSETIIRQSYPPAWQCSATCRKTVQDILGNPVMGGLTPLAVLLKKLLLPTNISFDWWHTACLISVTALMEKSKNWSICGSSIKTHRFFEIVSGNCQKDGKK